LRLVVHHRAADRTMVMGDLVLLEDQVNPVN
jgi:hypothetical protein